MIYRILLLVLMLAPYLSQAQMNIVEGADARILGNDTLCFQYTFLAGDTLRYEVVARDSVVVDGQPSFIKTRIEKMLVVCDSVSTLGNYYLHFILADITEKHIASGDTTTRTSHPWKGRKPSIVINNVGKRIETRSDQPEIGSMSAGGAFPPLLVPILDTSCGRQNQSWLSVDTLFAVENGYPVPVLFQQNYWRVLDFVDTLGCKAQQIQYTQTGIGTAAIATGSVLLESTNILAGYGRCTFDRSRNVIIHQFATVENKFTIKMGGGREVKGKRFITENATLLSLISTNPRRKYEVQLKQRVQPKKRK